MSSPESVPDVKSVDIMQGVLGELLTLVTNGTTYKAREITVLTCSPPLPPLLPP
ncbi:hypothetical protein Mapa_012233 [Marchantia paleacea]|nr:hypothetical protein Mapa_012233 [Marchantia paleacea]